jgi:lipoate-protein ligase A
LITTFGASPEFNMGLDEALLEDPDAPSTLRFYTWKPDTLSLGYFQKLAEIPARARAKAIVRRITGGGAIHHVHELTYSLIGSEKNAVFQGPVRASYERIHAAIQSALAELGVAAALRGTQALASDVAGTGMCFHKSTDLDLVWDGKKGVGSAQRRRHGRVLHHGSIKLASSPLEGDIATLRAHVPGLLVEDLALRLRTAFSATFALALESSVPDANERARTKELGRRYVDPEFVAQR